MRRKTLGQNWGREQQKVWLKPLSLSLFFILNKGTMHHSFRFLGLIRSPHNNLTDYSAASLQTIRPWFISSTPVCLLQSVCLWNSHFTVKGKKEKGLQEQSGERRTKTKSNVKLNTRRKNSIRERVCGISKGQNQQQIVLVWEHRASSVMRAGCSITVSFFLLEENGWFCWRQ